MATIAFDPRMKDGDDAMTVTLTGAVASAEITDNSITSADIKAGEIVNSDISASAGITEGKLAIANGKVLIGTAGGVGAAQTMSGDATLAANGALTIANDAVTSAKLDETTIQYAEVTISAADIVATGAGKFGHAAGYPIVADPGATKLVELMSAVLIYDYDTAAYTDGGNITVNINGGSALTGLISAANSVGAAGDKIAQFVPLAVASANLTANKGLNLVSSAAFTNPGTAAGVIRVKVAYRVHTHGLA